MFRRRSLFVPLLVLAPSATVAGGAYAQTSLDEVDRWRSQLEFGFTGASGNTSFSILTASVLLDRLERDQFELQLSGRVRYGDGNGEVIANDMLGTVKFDWVPQADWSPFIFGTVSRDVVRNLDGRVQAGGGVKWTFWRASDATKMSVSGAAIVDYENYRLDSGATTADSKRVGRFSGRVKFDHGFGSGATFQHITFWQPRVTDASDYVVDISNQLETTLVGNLSLVVTHSFIRQSVPPPGAVPNDQRLAVTLRVRF